MAIIWEGDEPGTGRSYTYREALQETCRIANVLLQYGVRKGDTVAMCVSFAVVTSLVTTVDLLARVMSLSVNSSCPQLPSDDP